MLLVIQLSKFNTGGYVMRKRTVLLTILLFVVSSSVTAVYASQNIMVQVDGKPVVFPDAKPFLDEKQRTLIPIRFVAEALGAKVKWDKEAKMATFHKGDTNIGLRIGESMAIVNNEWKRFDTKAILKQNRTYVPLRFISETLGAQVKWVAETRTVEICTTCKSEVKKEVPENAPKEFKEIVNKVDDIRVYSEKVIDYSQNGKYDEANIDLFILYSDYYKIYSLSVRNYNEDTLNKVKEVLKIYYPNSYEKVYNDVQQVIKTGNKIEKKYYDNRYFACYKFDNAASIKVGIVGVEIE